MIFTAKYEGMTKIRGNAIEKVPTTYATRLIFMRLNLVGDRQATDRSIDKYMVNKSTAVVG